MHDCVDADNVDYYVYERLEFQMNEINNNTKKNVRIQK